MVKFSVSAQELFPHNEPASSIPKGVLGYRTMYQGYNLDTYRKDQVSAGIMYGVSSKLSVFSYLTASNYHLNYIPDNFTMYIFNHKQINNEATPFAFKGIYNLVKYRFLTLDGPNKHFRMAAYGEISKINAYHFEAEPDLRGNNSGIGGGMISTLLYKKTALSATVGYTNPFAVNIREENIYMKSGNAYNANFSIGHLVFPKKYADYKELNVNVYLECINKFYQNAKLIVDELPSDPAFFNVLNAGRYSELRPSVQLIFDSNTRVDFSVGLPLSNTYRLRSYPLYFVTIQKYLFK
jgi:hypothetical protein